jgi:CRP-like cAMP-binding protein
MPLTGSPNHLLESLPPHDARLLERHLGSIQIAQGALLAAVGEQIERAIFPFSGAVSIVVELSSGQAIEAAMIGRNGVIGGSAAFGARIALVHAVAQFTLTGAVIDCATLRALAEQSPSLRIALMQWEQAMLAQAQQSAACNAVHGLGHRLCRWLAHAHDLIDGDSVPLTHDQLSRMLGVQRSSVTLAAQRLHDEAIIKYRRGRIEVKDADRLRRAACECYQRINDVFERQVGWQPKRETSGRAATTSWLG